MLVLVVHHEADGCSSGLPFEHAAEQFHAVLLLPVCGDAALSGPSSVQFVLNEVHVNLDAGRHSVDNAANSRPVALAEGGQRE